MSLFQNLGAAVGIGSCKIDVALTTPQVAWGDIARGTVTMTGGNVAQRIDWFKIAIIEHWTTQERRRSFSSDNSSDYETVHHYVPYGETALAAAFEIQPGQQYQWPFELPAPSGREFKHDWYVEAKAGIPSAVDQAGRTNFALVPPLLFVRVAGALGDVTGLRLRSWGLYNGGVAAELLPDGAQKQIYDGIRLELFLVGDQITGSVIVNPQERSLGDHFKALVQADRKKFQIAFPAADLDGARAQFQQIAAQFQR